MVGSVANNENLIADRVAKPSPGQEPTIQGLSPRLAWFGAAVAVAIAVFVTLACLVSRHPGTSSLDWRLITDVTGDRTASLNSTARAVTKLGTQIVLYPLIAAAAGLHWWRRGTAWPGISALLWLWAGQVVRTSINQSIARTRPPQELRLVGAGGYSFPSGHTASATIGYALLAVLVVRLIPAAGRWWRVLVVAAATILAVAVGLSRVYLGVHWPSDVAAGWVFGVAWLALGGLGITLGVRRIRMTEVPVQPGATNVR
jgi:membrane-associated phospholipid phosphatase